MKPTRTCNWPPRLDVTLRHPPRRCGSLRGRTRRPQEIHPHLRLVARARWAGRPARQRRFEKPASIRFVAV